MYTVTNLLSDSARQRISVSKQSLDEIHQVWDAFNRYMTEVMEKRQTLCLPTFCRIGWKVEEGMQRSKYRPHFNITEAFARSSNADPKSMISCPQRGLTHVEEFNFSKCALRFSQGLTKDVVFSCLRGIVHQLADAISSGKDVRIETEVGTLISSLRVIRFEFTPDFFVQDVTEGVEQRSILTPRPRTNENMTMLSREELAQQEAMQRHLAVIAEEASEAIKAQERWQGHLQRCADVEKKDLEWKHAIYKDYAHHLQDQIRHAEDQRQVRRQQAVEQPSAHPFPDFSKVPDIDVHEYMMDRKVNLKEDLDQQVEIKRRQKQIAKQRDRELDNITTERIHRDIAMQKLEEYAKREHQKKELSQSWDATRRLKDATKAISNFKARGGNGPAQTGLADMVTNLQQTFGASVPSNLQSLRSTLDPSGDILTAPATPRGFTPRQFDDRPPSSRPVTGSTRRFPIGAAASLALTKQRMAERGML